MHGGADERRTVGNGAGVGLHRGSGCLPHAAGVDCRIAEGTDDIQRIALRGRDLRQHHAGALRCQRRIGVRLHQVPYTRGRERSRSPKTILSEIEDLLKNNYKEVTLLGQNVNSYYWKEEGQEVSFAKLMAMVAEMSPEMRVRFATSHPKDLSDNLIETIARYDNICKCIHLPVQSGSNEMLAKMRRVYTRESYLERVRKIKEILPDCALTTDIIVGFCGETLENHQDTLSIMREVGYEYAYMFKYSERGGTLASKRYPDDIPDDEKTRRLEEVIALQGELSMESNRRDVGKTFRVLVEGTSKRSENQLFGRNNQNKVIIFPKGEHQIGDYADVMVTECTPATLIAMKQ